MAIDGVYLRLEVKMLEMGIHFLDDLALDEHEACWDIFRLYEVMWAQLNGLVGVVKGTEKEAFSIKARKVTCRHDVNIVVQELLNILIAPGDIAVDAQNVCTVGLQERLEYAVAFSHQERACGGYVDLDTYGARG